MSWSDLPNDLLASVAKRLDTGTDVRRFRAVCSSWRSSISSPQKSPPLPLMLPFPIYPCNIIRPERRAYFKLSETTVYHLQPPPCDTVHGTEFSRTTGWLLRVKETESGKVEIFDLFENRRIRQLPQTSSTIINLLKFRLWEITKYYNLQYVDIDNIPVTSIDEDPQAVAFTFHKVVLSSNPVSTANDYAVLAINNRGPLCYIKLGEEKWTVMSNIDYDGELQPFIACDIVDHNGQFYAVDVDGKVVVLNYSFEVIGIFESPTFDNSPAALPLFESLGDLFLVYKRFQPYYDEEETTGYVYMSVHIKVYKFDEEVHKWDDVNNLGDRALFVCYCDNLYFSISVQDFAGCKGNCIYFISDIACKVYSNLPICIGSPTQQSYSNIFWKRLTWPWPNSCSWSRC